jgi:hypothetical protein
MRKTKQVDVDKNLEDGQFKATERGREQAAGNCASDRQTETDIGCVGKLLLKEISRNGGKDRQMEESAQAAMTVVCRRQHNSFQSEEAAFSRQENGAAFCHPLSRQAKDGRAWRRLRRTPSGSHLLTRRKPFPRRLKCRQHGGKEENKI